MRYAFALVFCAMGIGLEYIQGLTDYRGFEYSDMFINSTGVGAWTSVKPYKIAEYSLLARIVGVAPHRLRDIHRSSCTLFHGRA